MITSHTHSIRINFPGSRYWGMSQLLDYLGYNRYYLLLTLRNKQEIVYYLTTSFRSVSRP